MKQIFFSLGIVMCLMVSACSKKNDNPGLASHDIQVNASGTAAYTIKVTTIKAGSSAAIVADTKTDITTAYEYHITLDQGDQIIVNISTKTANLVNYKIYDNNTVKLQGTKEMSTFSSTEAMYVAE